MKRLIECVPNFSEGRDPATVDALVAAMSNVPGAWVLDRESDADHNRSVITLAGEPEALAEAVLQGVGAAVELIDMRRQRGAHPRIGATDVVPFIPIEGCTIEDCVALAHRVGREIWERYRIPVYFYEAAATRPERINLEDVRSGQFEGLRSEVMRNPDRSPDIGEPRLHPTAGAIAVGARKFLIAYNIHLNTSDVSIAKQIAGAIRFSSGGLRYVKAMGVALETRGLAQVSINLTDFEQTPLHRVFEMVKREAGRHGCTIVGSEIVGLIPRKAIELASEFYLQLENFSPALLLENRLADALENMPAPAPDRETLASLARPLLDAFAVPAGTPAAHIARIAHIAHIEGPAGGSVTALAGAMAASLGERVAELARKKNSHAAFAEELNSSVEVLRRAAQTLAVLMDREARSSESVLAARNLPEEIAEEQVRRDAAIERAKRPAIEVSMETALAAVEVFENLVQLERLAPASMLSDLHVARLMAVMAVRGSLANVTVNLTSIGHTSIGDSAYVLDMKSRAAAIEARLAANPVPAAG